MIAFGKILELFILSYRAAGTYFNMIRTDLFNGHSMLLLVKTKLKLIKMPLSTFTLISKKKK